MSLQLNNQSNQRFLPVLQRALQAVDPIEAVRAVVRVESNLMTVAGRSFDLSTIDRIFVIGAGKASAPMTQAVESLLGGRISGGVVVVKDGHAAPTRHVTILEASHPIPDSRGVNASRHIQQLAESATANDLVIALLSGGGSALMADPEVGDSSSAPYPPISQPLTDLQAMTDLLLACGATINEINTLRKHCSFLKGGQLARAVFPAQLITLVLSDVVGSPLDVIASGPTVPDSSTWRNAWSVIEKYNLADRLPESIRRRLQAGLVGAIADTPKPGDPLFASSQTVVIGDNRIAALAAAEKASELGYNALLLSTFVEGEAQEVAKLVVGLAREVQSSSHPVAAPACLILGGETTVTLGSAKPGKGGRNQELALAAALRLQDSQGVTIACLATDGSDGPTDSAGAVVDGSTVERGHRQGMEAKDHLRRHDAYPFLAATGDLLISGPTQTNVNDLICIFVE